MQFNKILLYFNLFFLQSYLIRFKIGPYPTNLQEILLILQIFTFTYVILETKTLLPTLKNLKKYRIIIALLTLTALSAIFVPPENKTDFFRHLKFLVFASILSFIFLESFKTTAEKKSALKIAGYGAISFGIFSVIYNLLGYNAAPDNRLLGPLDAAVYLAFYLTPFFILFVIETLENSKKKSNLLCALPLGILILATKSMGAIAGSLLIIFLYLFKRSELKILQNKVTKISLSVIFLVLLTAIFYSKILPTIRTEYSSLDERSEIWTTSKELLTEPRNALLGIGLGQFQQQYFNNVERSIGRKPLDFYVLQPHNIFLLFIFNFGIAGLIFILYCLFKNLKNLNTIKDKDFLLTVNLILLYFFIHGLIDTPFFKNDLLTLLVIFLELSLENHEKHQTFLSPETRPNNTE